MSDPRGLMLIDKPKGLTSHDVVARTRRSLHTRKVGHAGTLDPMATGLLVLGVGRGTKLLTHAVGLAKSYEATVRLGIATSTDDAEGEVVSKRGCTSIAGLDRALLDFRGDIMQVPASVSAIKVGGKRAYALARAGADVKLKARPVTVSKLEVIGRPRFLDCDESNVAVVDIDVTLDCSSGTYVRAIARDLGDVLGTGGHLTALRRTQVGPWSVREAGEDLIDLGAACLALFPEVIDVDDSGANAFRHGSSTFAGESSAPLTKGASVVCNGHVLGIAKVKEGRLSPAFIIDPA